MNEFKLKAPYKPTGDQPQAIEKLVRGFKEGNQFETLLGVTGSGKTFTMANVIAQLNKPTLVLAHNKTLEIKKLNYKIKNILLDGLVQNIDVFQHYKNNAEEELAELDVSIKSTKSAISKLKKPSLPKACVKLENPTRPLQSDFVAKYTIIHKVLPFLK